MEYIFYYAVACLFMAVVIALCARRDDDITVGDALTIILVCAIPGLNIVTFYGAVRDELKASGINFTDRVLLRRKSK